MRNINFKNCYQHDAIFLPNNHNSRSGSVAIIYGNEKTTSDNGCFYIEFVNWRTIKFLYSNTQSVEEFFQLLPDQLSEDERHYIIGRDEAYKVLKSIYYSDADFIEGRDGTEYHEWQFLIDWALKQEGIYNLQTYALSENIALENNEAELMIDCVESRDFQLVFRNNYSEMYLQDTSEVLFDLLSREDDETERLDMITCVEFCQGINENLIDLAPFEYDGTEYEKQLNQLLKEKTVLENLMQRILKSKIKKGA